jgi:nucleoside 2-deoxyribosyltransferase
MRRFLEVLKKCRQRYGEQNVFPSEEHLQQSTPCIEAHHGCASETSETIETRSKLMREYFDRIDMADSVVIVNEKKEQEYYGVGTTIELGYAFARGKNICFTRKPTDANVLSLLRTIGKSRPKES